MGTSHIKSIDHTVQLTHEWVNELAVLLDWEKEDHQRTYRLLRVTLQTLRDWLQTDEAAQLAAQLPILIRGLYYEGWRPTKTPEHERTLEDFLTRIDGAFATDPLDDTEASVKAVFALLAQRVSSGEIDDVRKCLPRHLRWLWPVRFKVEPGN